VVQHNAQQSNAAMAGVAIFGEARAAANEMISRSVLNPL
jgi:hypothetical protein